MNNNVLSYRIRSTVRNLESELNDVFRRMHVGNIERIPSSASYAVSVSGKTAIFSPLLYQVDIFIWDENDGTVTLELNPVGDGAAEYFRTALTRERGVYHELKTSKKKAIEIASALRLR